MTSDHRSGTCRWCREKGEIYRDNLLCDRCDSDTIHCRICRCRQHYESRCRHVFQDENFEWRGAGVDPGDADLKRPFHLLLSAMGERFVRDLKVAIRSGKFHTWMVAPMIGGGGILTLYGMPDSDVRWGDRLINLGESDRAEVLADGYRWLVSLYNRNTTKANRTTLWWIDQWLWPFSRLDRENPDA